MKKLIFLALLFLVLATEVRAQEGYTRLNVSTGWLHKNALTGTVALEFGKKYHSYVEVFADAYQSQHDNTESYLAGVAYKPNLLRSTNTYFNLRAGAGIGSDTNNVIAGLQAGFELGYIFTGNYVLLLHQKNEALLGVTHPLRSGLLVGIKIPL